MPFTPLHFGPGAALKVAGKSHISFTLFCYTQIIMDLEPGYFLIRHEYPVHRFFHTYLGATLVAAICILTGRPFCEWLLRIWRRIPAAPLNEVFADSTSIPWMIAVITALVGAYSHVFLDSIMHSDMRPLAPFSDANSMLHIVNIGLLHFMCLSLGVVGLLLWVHLRKR